MNKMSAFVCYCIILIRHSFRCHLINDFAKRPEITLFVMKSDVEITFSKLEHYTICEWYSGREGTSDFGLPTSDFRLRTSDFRLQTSDFRLPTSVFRLPTSDFRLQTSDFRLQTSVQLSSSSYRQGKK